MTRDWDGRLSEKEARAAPFCLDDRDHTILLALHAVRFITAPLVLALLGIHPSNVSQRLKALYRHRYVERMPHMVQRGTGAPRHVYTLDVLGQEYVEAVTGCPDGRRRRADRPASTYFIEHYLAIAELYVALQVAVQKAGLSLVWLNEVEAAYRYTLPSGQERRLEPDGVFLLGGPGVTPTTVFIEVDRSTEWAQQWQRKVRDYSAYFLAREGFLAQWSTWPPRLLILVTVLRPARVEFLRRYTAGEWAVARRGEILPIGFAVHDQVCSGDILEQSWTGLDGQVLRILERWTLRARKWSRGAVGPATDLALRLRAGGGGPAGLAWTAPADAARFSPDLSPGQPARRTGVVSRAAGAARLTTPSTRTHFVRGVGGGRAGMLREERHARKREANRGEIA